MPTIDDGRSAISQGNLQGARLIFEAILQENPRSEEAWLGLAQVLPETEDKRICFENVLKINKTNRLAKEGLRNLEPQANPLVAALAPQPPPKEPADELFDEEDSMLTSARSEFESTEEEARQTPTPLLVAVGLALAVVVFAVGGGAVYLAITALLGR
jgi:hypothetical protein